MAYKKETGDLTDNPVGAIIRKAEDNFINGQTTSSKYVNKNMYEDLCKIDAYLNSKHTTGDTDSMGRDKPFFNIVTAAVNIWYRATDIDRKNIRIEATKLKDTIAAFLATIHLQSWMRKTNFGAFLNDWGRSLARYGSSVVKFVEKEGTLIPSVIPWQRLIVDAVDFENNPVIEVIELTEAQLYNRQGYDKDMVEKLCDARKARETIGKDQKDQKDDYIKLYEIHGNMPLSYLTGKAADEDTYVQQMHVISFVASKEKGKFDDFTLVSGKEEKNPYMLTHLIKEDGQTLSIGAVQHLFDAQWMMNHTVKSIKDQLDLASKLIFQTSDGNFVGQNVLTAIETGDILIHALNQPLTQINNGSHDISSLQAFGNQWKALSSEINGISESMLGNTAPSGTAWRQVEALLNESHSLFDLMIENKLLAVEDMMRMYVIPHLKTKMDTKDEVSATLADYNITKIDAQYIKNSVARNVNRKILKNAFKGKPVRPEDQMMMMQGEQQGISEDLRNLAGQRFFKPSELDDKTWKEVIKDLEWEVVCDGGGESSDIQAFYTTMNTTLATVMNPAYANNPKAQFIVNKILLKSGEISPIELSSIPEPQPQMPQMHDSSMMAQGQSMMSQSPMNKPQTVT